MENVVTYVPHKGDQAQLFRDRHNQDVMVIWRHSKVVWIGSKESGWLEDSRITVRNFTVALPIQSYADFKTEKRPK